MGGLERGGRLGGCRNHLHATPSAAVRSLDRDRPAVFVAEGGYLRSVGEEFGGAGHALNVDTGGGLTGADLVAHHLDRLGRWADKCHSPFADRSGEVGVLAEEPVAGMHGLGSGSFDHAQYGLGVEVALGCALSAQSVGLVRQPDVEGIAVEFGVHRNGWDPHLLARPDDPNRNFSPIGDQDLRKHRPMVSRAEHDCKVSWP